MRQLYNYMRIRGLDLIKESSWGFERSNIDRIIVSDLFWKEVLAGSSVVSTDLKDSVKGILGYVSDIPIYVSRGVKFENILWVLKTGEILTRNVI